VYMHNPRGSNDRLNEQSANRNNADRLFDSQNNNRGGYNVGDKGTNAANSAYENDPDSMYSYADAATNTKQYSLAYYAGSKMLVEWTNQHGCGGNEENDPYNLNCQIILQYMCDTDVPAGDGNRALGVWLYDGLNTNTPTEPNNFGDTEESDDVNDDEGHHESSGWYYECKQTDRNDGLFHADQNLNGDDARYTRQNPNGDRRGLECPEERDYYPYWRPSPWKDIAYMTTDVQPVGQSAEDAAVDPTFPCQRIIAESQNVGSKGKCLGFVNNNQQAPWSREDCEASAQGTWMEFSHDITEPVCKMVDWSRANHLGNGRDNQPLTYNWTLPTHDNGNGDLGSTRRFGTTYPSSKCVLRIRYNISTDDYDPFYTDSEYDGDDFFPENPTVDIGANMIGLKLAINTNQFGRTFQDRSHIFYIVDRPAGIDEDAEVWNLNVRGKRGNIVQTYPSVEYDFQPNRLHIPEGTFIHLQWTGSNTHNNGNPGGDGQTGDAGEGTGGTDRNNFVQLDDISQNWPIPLDVEQYEDNIFAGAEQCWYLNGAVIGQANPADRRWIDCATTVATSGLYRDHVNDQYTNFNPTLDNAYASLIGGVVFQPAAGTYNYMCTRNNNFSNRSQKGTLIVEA
jgi:hypothetical protein